jgi:hypothetical protein
LGSNKKGKNNRKCRKGLRAATWIFVIFGWRGIFGMVKILFT